MRKDKRAGRRHNYSARPFVRSSVLICNDFELNDILLVVVCGPAAIAAVCRRDKWKRKQRTAAADESIMIR